MCAVREQYTRKSGKIVGCSFTAREYRRRPESRVKRVSHCYDCECVLFQNSTNSQGFRNSLSTPKYRLK